MRRHSLDRYEVEETITYDCTCVSQAPHSLHSIHIRFDMLSILSSQRYLLMLDFASIRLHQPQANIAA